MTARRLVVWRHGQTDWNNQQRWQGQADIPLNDIGRAQARHAAPVLADYGLTHLWSSDLARAAETADIVASCVGVPVHQDRRLREIDVGDWSGRSVSDLGAEAQQILRAEEAGEDVVRGRTGESVRQVAHRVASAFREIAGCVPDHSVVGIAMHGLSARVGAFELMGLAPSMDACFRGLENCAWLVLDRGRRRDGSSCWRLEAYNQKA